MVNAAAAKEAEALKEQGNSHFQRGDYHTATNLYTRAISLNPNHSTYYTNRALANLKLQSWSEVISDCHTALSLSPNNLKAFTYLGQANLALDRPNEALEASKRAYELAVQQRSPSAASIAQGVLKAKKRVWEVREEMRLKREGGLMTYMVRLLEEECKREKRRVLEERRNGKAEARDHGGGQKDRKDEDEMDIDVTIPTPGEYFSSQALPTPPNNSSDPTNNIFTNDPDLQEELTNIDHLFHDRIEGLKSVFALAHPSTHKPRTVPDYYIDNITFSVMYDPVVTKHGQSYERSTLLEHLRRSKTDPLTREPLIEEELRPNLALRQACEDYLEENGWAVDW